MLASAPVRVRTQSRLGICGPVACGWRRHRRCSFRCPPLRTLPAEGGSALVDNRHWRDTCSAAIALFGLLADWLLQVCVGGEGASHRIGRVLLDAPDRAADAEEETLLDLRALIAAHIPTACGWGPVDAQPLSVCVST